MYINHEFEPWHIFESRLFRRFSFRTPLVAAGRLCEFPPEPLGYRRSLQGSCPQPWSRYLAGEVMSWLFDF